MDNHVVSVSVICEGIAGLVEFFCEIERFRRGYSRDKLDG